jgi:1,4-dihydroxy-2-naphthoate octaprenyltransferase
VVLLVGTGTFPIAALIVLLALQKLATVWRPFSRPKPAEPPENFPIWPLWFAALAFVHTRRAGGLLVLGLIVGVILGW